MIEFPMEPSVASHLSTLQDKNPPVKIHLSNENGFLVWAVVLKDDPEYWLGAFSELAHARGYCKFHGLPFEVEVKTANPTATPEQLRSLTSHSLRQQVADLEVLAECVRKIRKRNLTTRVEFTVDDHTYLTSVDTEPDNIKLSHLVILPNATEAYPSWSPYDKMNETDLRLWIAAGYPERGDRSAPIDSKALIQILIEEVRKS